MPISRSTFFQYVKDGKFPKPIKLSPRITVWRAADVNEWMAKQGQITAKAVH
ncbi:AlpA family phage regulatory protein [Rhodanobacter sp. AS-Z3]|uniref:helix-turn-helix transcriptional regulator n=1 Tax=Rhodanobacter sp. AS-Z3 TaxID=3031330 RepID=UPI0024798D0F|nr:AlpA family phage regulatory protein [Rhodanobacter sp. AS-Z3]WEN13866.1 AlpA family phage regulatory protein [Rhodanobacter sp. AS-Z3]